MTVETLMELLKQLPKDAEVIQSSGEQGSILSIISKNGRKSWFINKKGELK